MHNPIVTILGERAVGIMLDDEDFEEFMKFWENSKIPLAVDPSTHGHAGLRNLMAYNTPYQKILDNIKNWPAEFEAHDDRIRIKQPPPALWLSLIAPQDRIEFGAFCAKLVQPLWDNASLPEPVKSSLQLIWLSESELTQRGVPAPYAEMVKSKVEIAHFKIQELLTDANNASDRILVEKLKAAEKAARAVCAAAAASRAVANSGEQKDAGCKSAEAAARCAVEAIEAPEKKQSLLKSIWDKFDNFPKTGRS